MSKQANKNTSADDVDLGHVDGLTPTTQRRDINPSLLLDEGGRDFGNESYLLAPPRDTSNGVRELPMHTDPDPGIPGKAGLPEDVSDQTPEGRAILEDPAKITGLDGVPNGDDSIRTIAEKPIGGFADIGPRPLGDNVLLSEAGNHQSIHRLEAEHEYEWNRILKELGDPVAVKERHLGYFTPTGNVSEPTTMNALLNTSGLIPGVTGAVLTDPYIRYADLHALSKKLGQEMSDLGKFNFGSVEISASKDYAADDQGNLSRKYVIYSGTPTGVEPGSLFESMNVYSWAQANRQALLPPRRGFVHVHPMGAIRPKVNDYASISDIESLVYENIRVGAVNPGTNLPTHAAIIVETPTGHKVIHFGSVYKLNMVLNGGRVEVSYASGSPDAKVKTYRAQGLFSRANIQVVGRKDERTSMNGNTDNERLAKPIRINNLSSDADFNQILERANQIARSQNIQMAEYQINFSGTPAATKNQVLAQLRALGYRPERKPWHSLADGKFSKEPASKESLKSWLFTWTAPVPSEPKHTDSTLTQRIKSLFR